MKVIDPRNFDLNSIKEDKISNTIESFYKNDKSGFLQSYSELADVDKFFTLTSTVLTFSNVENAKMMYLEELKNDLMILKVLNRGFSTRSNTGTEVLKYKKIIKQLPKGYQSYWKSEIVSDTIAKFENIANQIKNNLK